MEATRLIAVRHGETDWNADTRIQGHIDIPLNETGLWQAARAGEALADEAVGAIYASDLQRAWQTAQAIAAAQPRPVQVVADPRLRERAFGSFEGRTFAAIEAETPEDARRWRQRDPTSRRPAARTWSTSVSASPPQPPSWRRATPANWWYWWRTAV